MAAYMEQLVSLKEKVSSSFNGLLSSNTESVELNINERVQVEAFTGSTKVAVGKNKTECTPVLVRVTAAPEPPPTRLPLDVVAVLDVSSSMKGREERMEAAMKAVIKKLHGNDRLSLVSLEDVAIEEIPPTLMDAKGCETAKKTITSIKSKTRFRMCGKSLGTEALGIVHRQMENTATTAGQQNRQRCVMLLSCGEDQLNITQWITEVTKLNFQFCSFDIGEHYDAGRFKCVAEAGASAYHYIVNESHTSITDSFESFIDGLRTVVATSVKLSLKAEVAGGFTISSVESGGHYYCRSSDSEHEIHIAGMHAGEKKSFVVYLEGAMAVATENILSITASANCQQGSSSSKTDLQPCLLPGKEVTVTMNSDVAAEVVRSRLVTEVKEILVKEVKVTEANGEIKVTEAKEEIKVTEVEVHEEVEKRWNGIKVSVSAMYEVAKSTDLLKHIDKDVTEVMKQHGHSYMMSWLSCHWWQRATTMSRYSYAFKASSTRTRIPATTEKNPWRQPCFLGVVGVLILVLMVMLLRQWWRQPLPLPPIPSTALDVGKHPEWPAMKGSLDGMLRGAKDDRFTSFFKGATSRDMNQQIDQYLYMAILYAAVLRAHYEGTSTTALVSDKVVRSHAEMYIQTMLTRTKSSAIPSLQVASHTHMSQELSKYLYSTIVQAEVLVTIRTPEREITADEKIKELEDKNGKLEKEKKELLEKIEALEKEKRDCCRRAEECKQKLNGN